MIQIIDGLPDNVVGIIAKGRVTNNDCDQILRPAMESTLKRHHKVRLYYQIGCRFPGAAWENLRVGIEPIPQWERVAIVTDVGWGQAHGQRATLFDPGRGTGVYDP